MQRRGGIIGPVGVIAGAQGPRLKNETKQDATLTLRLFVVSWGWTTAGVSVIHEREPYESSQRVELLVS